MAKKLLAVLFATVLALSVAVPVFAQDAPAPEKTAKLSRWEGTVARMNRDKSTLVVRSSDSVEKTVEYDSSTQWTSQEHHSNKVNPIDASQVNDNDRVICQGTWGKGGVLHATMISKRLTN